MSENYKIKNKEFFIINFIGILVLVLLNCFMGSYLQIDTDIGEISMVIKFNYNFITLMLFLFLVVLISGFINLKLESTILESLIPLLVVLGLMIGGFASLLGKENNNTVLSYFIVLVLYFIYLICYLFVLDKTKWYKYLSLCFPVLWYVSVIFSREYSLTGHLLLIAIALVFLGANVLILLVNKKDEKRGFLLNGVMNTFLFASYLFMFYLGGAN